MIVGRASDLSHSTRDTAHAAVAGDGTRVDAIDDTAAGESTGNTAHASELVDLGARDECRQHGGSDVTRVLAVFDDSIVGACDTACVHISGSNLSGVVAIAHYCALEVLTDDTSNPATVT